MRRRIRRRINGVQRRPQPLAGVDVPVDELVVSILVGRDFSRLDLWATSGPASHPPPVPLVGLWSRPGGQETPTVTGPSTHDRVRPRHEEEVEMSRTIWFVLGIIGLIVVIIWVVNLI